MCILFYQFLKERGAKWHLYVKYAQMFLQTTELCRLYLKDKGSAWLPERGECMSTQRLFTFQKPEGASLLEIQKVSEARSLSGHC